MEKLGESLSVRRALHALGYAVSGFRYALINESSFLRAVIIVIIVGGLLAWYLWPMSPVEAAIFVAAAMLILITEIVNTSIEMLADMVQPEHDVRIKRIKDCAAAATLLSSSAGAIIAALLVWAS